VNYPERYTLAFHGLKPGAHQFDYHVGAKFFEVAEDSEISDGAISVTVKMVKEERMMDLHFTLAGHVVVRCDRCADPLDIDVAGEERLIIKLGDRFEEETDEVQIIPESLHQLDLAPFIYEYIHLLLPARKVHPDDEQGVSTCNPAILDKLRELTGHPAADPRWDALKKLKEQ